MAYTKTDWACGDKITAEKLNKIEQGIKDAQNGYECTESYTLLTEETVTTFASDDAAGNRLAYTTLIDADTIKVTFNGVSYECNKREGDGGFEYGAPSTYGFDFSEYPFSMFSDTGYNYLATQTAGTYTIKIETLEESLNTTECFCKAVNECADLGYECTQSEVTLASSETISTSEGNAFLSYTNLIDTDTLVVYFDGTRYECPKISGSNYNAYGGYSSSEDDTDFSEYPFAIRSSIQTEMVEYRNTVYTETAGTHTIELKTISEVVNTSECFEKAVKKFVGYECEEAYTEVFNETITTESDGSPNPPYFTDSSLSLTADTIKVTFDGTEYECDAEKFIGIGGTSYLYGSTTFEDYPFSISSASGSGTKIATETAGDYSVSIKALGTVATTSECFDTAARKAVNASGKCVQIPRVFVSESQQSLNRPIVPYNTSLLIFQNTEAISIAQGQYGTATLVSNNSTNIRMLFAIMSIFVNNGHLPPITNIKVSYDNVAGRMKYEIELYARDSAISIGASALQLSAVTLEAPSVQEALCVVEGTCCEGEEPE